MQKEVILKINGTKIHFESSNKTFCNVTCLQTIKAQLITTEQVPGLPDAM